MRFISVLDVDVKFERSLTILMDILQGARKSSADHLLWRGSVGVRQFSCREGQGSLADGGQGELQCPKLWLRSPYQ